MVGQAQMRIAVLDPASAYRRGLGSAFAAAGHVVRDVEDVDLHSLLDSVDAVLVTVRSASDWTRLREIVAIDQRVKLVALLVDPTPDRHAEALRCGAHGVVAWEATPETILPVVSAALEDRTLLPTSVARAMSASGPALYDPGWITEEEIRRLKLLASGMTTQQLAATAGYSERAMYRVLHGLYGRLRVSSRTEAIVQASRWGLLDDQTEPASVPPAGP